MKIWKNRKDVSMKNGLNPKKERHWNTQPVSIIKRKQVRFRMLERQQQSQK